MNVLQTRRLTKTYGSGAIAVRALAGVDVDIHEGEFVSIMGPSGSGKSTLMHMIGLLDAPTDGAVRIMGEVTDHMDAKDRTLARRRYIGFVFQAFHLLPRASAISNVVLPMALAGVARKERHLRAEAALRAVGLGDRIEHRPSELSGGQKQRVAIARALALDPPIILADEPTGNLDSTTSKEVMALFKRLNQEGKTIVQVTHDLNMAQYGNRIITLRDGLISEEERLRAPPTRPRSAPRDSPDRAPTGTPRRTHAETPRRASKPRVIHVPYAGPERKGRRKAPDGEPRSAGKTADGPTGPDREQAGGHR